MKRKQRCKERFVGYEHIGIATFGHDTKAKFGTVDKAKCLYMKVTSQVVPNTKPHKLILSADEVVFEKVE